MLKLLYRVLIGAAVAVVAVLVTVVALLLDGPEGVQSRFSMVPVVLLLLILLLTDVEFKADDDEVGPLL